MPLDTSIYFKGPQFNTTESLEKGVRLGQLIRGGISDMQDRQRTEQANNAYLANLQTGPDGQPTLNRKGFMRGLMETGQGQLAGQYQQQWAKEDAAKKQQEIENAQKQQHFNILQQQNALDNWYKRAQVGLEGQKAQAQALTGENLPIDAKRVVTDLSAKNAAKTGIKNQIDSVMAGWGSLSDDQKLAAGRQLLKTLNSPEGADAIGAEEANRLGSKLEFAMGNLFNSNPTQFGRDLKGFEEQAKNTAKFLGDAITRNQEEIDVKMGRKKQSGTTFSQDVMDYAKRYGISNEQAQQIKNQRTGGQ